MTWRARADFDFAFDGPRLYIMRRTGAGIEHVSSLEMEPQPDGHIGPLSVPDPMLVGDSAVAFMQAIMDAAYEYGLRPGAAQDERHMKAHLEDMRMIAFSALKIPSKP